MKDLFEYKPEFFYGCTVKKRKIIEKKSISSSHYVYANYLVKTREWNISDENCKKAQLLFTKEWVDTYFFSPATASPQPNIKRFKVDRRPPLILEENIRDKPDQSIVVPSVKEESSNLLIAKEEFILEEDIITRKEEEDIENAPPILELEEEERFKDVNGNVIEIEVRGVKERNNIFFRLKDIMKAFEMPNLDITLREKTTSYEKGLHYKHFFIRVSQNMLFTTTIKKSLYLTYKGLLRVLFNSRKSNAEHFQDWAEDKLFTIQMGTKEKKDVLGANILNIKLENIRAVFSKYSQTFPCIYLLSLGKVGQLREDFGIASDIDDSLTVYKYGFTDDMKRRLGEHNRDYGKYQNVKIELELFSYIDPKYTSEAEGDIRDIFESFGKALKVQGRRELVTLNSKEFERIKKEYNRTGKEFAGVSEELHKENETLKIEIGKLKYELTIQEERKQNEIAQLKLTHQLELQREINEKDKYKTQLANMEIITSLKEEKYALKDAHSAQIQMFIDKIK
jgi:hypothetical protein